MSKDNPEILLQDMIERRRELRKLLANYTTVYEKLTERLKRVEATDEAKEAERKALDNLITIEDEYDRLKDLIDRAKRLKD